MAIRRAGMMSMLVCCAPAYAAQIPTRAALDTLLGDQILTEDFEGTSVPGGTSRPAPNPLSSATAPTWGLLPGVVYLSLTQPLVLYGGFLHGDSSNILQTSGTLRITFAQAQRAVGFDLANGSGNVNFGESIVFYHGATALGSLDITVPAASDRFAGWQDTSVGITSVTITGTTFSPGVNGPVQIDNVSWGIVVTPPPCAADANADGVVNSADLSVLLAQFGQSVTPGTGADFNADGIVNSADLSVLLGAFGIACG